MIKTRQVMIEEIKKQLLDDELEPDTREQLELRLSVLEEVVEGAKATARWKKKLYQKAWKTELLKGELWPDMFMDDEWEEVMPEIFDGKFLYTAAGYVGVFFSSECTLKNS